MSKISFDQNMQSDLISEKLCEINLFPFERSDIDEIALSNIKYEQLIGLTETDQSLLFNSSLITKQQIRRLLYRIV